jgi:hypothetical protein
MNASNNHKNGWVKAVVGMVVVASLVSFNAGCDYVPDSWNINGPRNPSVNPIGPGVFDDKPMCAPTTHTTTCVPSSQCGQDDLTSLFNLLCGLA